MPIHAQMQMSGDPPPPPPTVLVLDDDPCDRLLAVRALRREFTGARFVEVGDAAAFERALEGGYDIALTDYAMGWTTGLDVLRTLKRRHPDRPVVMFTGNGDEELAVEAMRDGLDDYVVKSPRLAAKLPMVMRRALQAAVERARARSTERRLGGLLDRLDVGWFRTTPAGDVFECNEAFARLCGHADADEVRRRPAAAVERAGIDGDQRLRRTDGSIAWVHCVEVEDASGGREGVALDVGERRRLEREVLEIQDRERERIARDLHDGLGQLLAGLGLMASGFGRRLGERAPELLPAYEPLVETTRRAQQDCRDIAHEHAAQVVTYGLAASLSQLAAETNAAGLGCVARCEPDTDLVLPRGYAHELYRIAQEATANAVRHARARRLSIGLAALRGAVRLEIRDDGCGTLPPAAGDGFGIRTMRYRASRLGASLRIDAVPGEGTTVTVEVPVESLRD